MKISGSITLTPSRVYSCHNQPVLTCMPIDQKNFITAGFDGLLGRIDNSREDIDAFIFEKGFHNGIIFKFLNLSETQFCSCGQDKIRINETSTYKECSTLSKEGGFWRCVELIDENTLAAGGSDSIISVWSLSDKNKLYDLTGHESFILAMLCLNDKTLISSGNDKKMIIWDLTTKTIKKKIDLDSSIRSFCIVENNRFVSGDESGKVVLWNNEGDSMNLVEAHKGSILVIQKLLWGHVWCTAGKDKSLIFWNMKKLEMVGKYEGVHFDTITDVKEFGNNKLITCSYDTLVKVWDIKY